MLARVWRVTPAALRACTARDIRAMWQVLDDESQLRK